MATSLTLFVDRAVWIPNASLSEVKIEISCKFTCRCTASLLIFVLYWRRNEVAVFYGRLDADMHVSIGNFNLELVTNYK